MTPETGAEHVAGLSYCDRWGPFAADILDAERVARLRSLRTAVHLLCPGRADVLTAMLAMCEVDSEWLCDAAAELSRLPTRDRRNVLSAYGRTNCPNWNR